MDDLFSGCSSLISIPDISRWKVENAKFVGNLFSECSSLISIPDISKWNTNLQDIESDNIFQCCSLIKKYTKIFNIN